jgi:hypothetical protein
MKVWRDDKFSPTDLKTIMTEDYERMKNSKNYLKETEELKILKLQTEIKNLDTKLNSISGSGKEDKQIEETDRSKNITKSLSEYKTITDFKHEEQFYEYENLMTNFDKKRCKVMFNLSFSSLMELVSKLLSFLMMNSETLLDFIKRSNPVSLHEVLQMLKYYIRYNRYKTSLVIFLINSEHSTPQLLEVKEVFLISNSKPEEQILLTVRERT